MRAYMQKPTGKLYTQHAPTHPHTNTLETDTHACPKCTQT